MVRHLNTLFWTKIVLFFSENRHSEVYRVGGEVREKISTTQLNSNKFTSLYFKYILNLHYNLIPISSIHIGSNLISPV